MSLLCLWNKVHILVHDLAVGYGRKLVFKYPSSVAISYFFNNLLISYLCFEAKVIIHIHELYASPSSV
jgi:hypothetical protein